MLVYGKYTLLDRANPAVHAYTREGNGKRMLILLNFTGKPSATTTGLLLNGARMVLTTYTTAPAGNVTASEVKLRPGEALVHEW